jgi:hypothetical protein
LPIHFKPQENRNFIILDGETQKIP